MSKHHKLEYSTRDTLSNIKLKPNYTFVLSKDIVWAWIKKWDFEEWDIFEIIEIELKEETDKSTHNVKFKVTNHKWKTKEYEMSGWIFMKNFSEQIDSSVIAYKEIEKIKEDVKTKVVELEGIPEKKWLVEKIKEKIKDKMKWKKKK